MYKRASSREGCTSDSGVEKVKETKHQRADDLDCAGSTAAMSSRK
jgi:hypothetical protein